MGRNKNVLRGGAVLLGVGAILAAAAAPGAVAQSTGPATASITRALLTQANAANTETALQLLVTQVQVDGEGQIAFDVPVVEGANPTNMDGFGGPTVENGQAVYNLDVNGPETFRTKQDGSTVDVPVKLTVKAKLNGQPIDPTELKNVTGRVELAYTASNLTENPVTLEWENGNGDIVKEDTDIKTGMGGTLDITFPPSWTNFESEDVEVISGDGSGNTLVSGGFTLMEPFGEPTGTITIKADVTNGNMPPAVLQFLVLEPKDNPTARAISESLAGGASSGQGIYEGGKTLDAGADQLIEGLTTAVDGATQIADGVEFDLLAGINTLWDKFSASAKDKEANATVQLVDQVRSEAAYNQLLSGFDELNSDTGLYKIQNILGKVIDQLGSPFDLPIGEGVFDSGSQTANSLISSMVWGANNLPRPALGAAATKPQRGITNPNYNTVDPNDVKNPAGMVQLLDLVLADTTLSDTNKAFLNEVRNSLVPGPASGLGAIAFQRVNGWPAGCRPNDGAAYAYPDDFGCYYSPQQAAAGIVAGNTDLSTLLLALGLSLGKGPVTTSGPFNPTLQVDKDFNFSLAGVSATYTDTLKFGVCLGPEADETLVATHCSAAQVLSFLSAGVSGTPVKGFTQTTNPGPLASKPNAVERNLNTPWSDPVVGAVAPGCVDIAPFQPPNTIASAPDTATEVKPFGAACAVRTLKDSLNQILLPTIGEGVRQETVDSLGNGVYSPNCDPDATPTLTCGISALRAGITDPLQPGTRQLADGLPAALDGVKQIKTDGAGALLEQGNDAAEDYGRQVALYNAMNNPDLVSKYIPGGAPTGDDITYNGVYKFELSGVGSQGTNTGTNFALGILGLLAAGGVGIWASTRRKAA